MTLWTEHVGARSSKVRNVVEAGAVRKFAEAIGDPNPLYVDEAYAASTRWGRRLAPPTFPRTFDFGQVPGVILPPVGVIHGEQAFTYRRPIFVGDVLDCHTRLLESYEKRGTSAVLHFLVFERVAEDAKGSAVMNSRDVYILTPAVRAEVAL